MRTHARASTGVHDVARHPTPAPTLPPTVRQRAARLPLRWRLALGYALLLLLVLAPLAALQAAAIHTLLLKDASTALMASAQAEVTWAPKPPKGVTVTSSAATIAQRAIARHDLDAAVVADASGRVLASAVRSGEGAPDAARLVDGARLRQTLGQPAGTAQPYQIATARGPYLIALTVLSAPKPHGGKGAAAPHVPGAPAVPAAAGQPAPEILVLARSLRPLNTVTAYVWTLTLAGTALALLVATAFGALLVQRALRPLMRVAGAADAVAAGDYARRVAVPPTRDEVGRLAVAFNTMAAAVEESFAAQRRFVADAAHELRTPLTALGGYADMLLMGAATEPRELAAALEAMRGETGRMTRLVNDLLALARLDAGAPAVHPDDVDLAAVLRDAYTGAQLLHPDRRLTLDIAASPLPVHGDADRLRQVVANLLDNAVKFSESGGHIALALCRDRTDALLAVHDDGIGIAPEDLPHVRERFYRADRARSHTTETAGTGLGLAIVQAIVAAHNGSLDIDSRPGRWTTVTVRLPSVGGRIARARTADSVRPA